MKLIQLNAWGGKLHYQILNFLKEANADIVCLQEVHDLEGPTNALFVTLNELKDKLEYSSGVMAPVYSFHFMNREADYGNAILSKLPVVSHNVMFTKGEYEKSFDMTDGADIRNFQHAKMSVNGKFIHVINYHGTYLKDSKKGNGDTKRQINLIAEYAQRLEGPVLVSGDFNLTPSSDSLLSLNRLLRNLSIESGITSTYSDFSIHHTVSDYIFVNDEIKVNETYASSELLSDHKALVLDFDIE